MRIFLLFAFLFASLTIAMVASKAQTIESSAQAVTRILNNSNHRQEMERLKTGITTVLADPRLTDQAVRQMLTESQSVLTEMLDQRVGTNTGKLVDLAKWMRAQAFEQRAIKDAEGTPTPQQQFVLDNVLAGQEPYLTELISWVLNEYVQRDGDSAGAAKLEGYLQLYLHCAVEISWVMSDSLLFCAPKWIQSRYPQLAAEEKRRFLRDVNGARKEKTLGPSSDTVPGPTPTAAEQRAYNAAYRFIVSNTPKP